MVLRARDVMTHVVLIAHADMPIEQAAALLAEHRFSALPVVDDNNRLIGILSEADLLREPRGSAGIAGPQTVGGVMSRDVVYLSPDADVRVVAHRLRGERELRVMPIVDHGVLAGVVTRGDLLRRRERGGTLGRLAGRVRDGLRRLVSSDPATSVQLPERGQATTVTAGTRPGGGQARDVMAPRAAIVVVGEATSTAQAAALLAEHRLSALPVVDSHGRLIGIISEADLLRDPLDGRRTPPAPTVGAAMTTNVISRPPDADVHELARLLSDGGLRVVPIVEGGRLVGVVSRGDLLRP